MLTIMVRYKSKPGMEDVMASALAKSVAATRREPGCLQFVIYRSVEKPDAFVIYEQYGDADAVAAHRETPHYLEMHRVVAPILADRQRDVYDEVAPDGTDGGR